MARLIPSDKQTDWYLYCITCADQRPQGTALEDWGSFYVCLTEVGVQIWCRRCDHNVAHFDFDGHALCVNMKTGPTFGTRVAALVEDQRARDFWRRRKPLTTQ